MTLTYCLEAEKLIGTKINDVDLLFRGRLNMTLTITLTHIMNRMVTRPRHYVTLESQGHDES